MRFEIVMTLGFGVERKGSSFTEVRDKIRQGKKCGGLAEVGDGGVEAWEA